MKTRNILIQLVIIACSGLLFQGCQKEEPEGLVTLKAVVSDDYGHHAGSMTYIRGKFVYWDNGDSININGTPFKIDITTGETKTTATIEGVPESGSGYVAVYPARFVTTPASVTASSTSVAVKIPSILYMKPGERQNTQGLMVAKTAAGGNTLSFHHAGSVLALQVTNGFTNDAELKLYRIVVKSSTSGLSGAGTLTIDGSAPSYSITGSDSLTLDMEDDTILHNATKTYYIPIPPQEQDGGTQFTIIIYATNDDNHYKFTRNSRSGLTVQRNKQVPVSVELSAANVDYTINTINGNSGLMGSGTESDPYVIATLTDLKYFRTQVNGGNTYSSKYIRQTADIDASANNWTPIGTSTNKFSGIYDGGGHTVTIAMNPTNNNGFGFFNYLNGATVKNLTMDGSCAANSNYQIGAFCGIIGDGACTFDNCTNKIDIVGSCNLGGIIGSVTFGTSITMTYCVNEGDVTGDDSKKDNGIAGIIGKTTKTTTINKCKNAGTITCTGANKDGAYVGGLLGFTNGTVTVSNSCNTGNLAIKCVFAAAGLVAQLRNMTTSSPINNCYNHGSINFTGNTASQFAGGVVTAANSTKPTVKNCYFSGSITGTSPLYRGDIGSFASNSSVTASYCHAINKYSGSFCTTANYTITKDATTDMYNSSSGSTLKTALNNWVNNNSGYDKWTSDDDTHLPTLSWE